MRTPTLPGQICEILTPMEDENPSDVYIVAEDPAPFDLDDDIYIVNLRELQKNLGIPSVAPQIAIRKADLNVVAENLEEYIMSWNSDEHN